MFYGNLLYVDIINITSMAILIILDIFFIYSLLKKYLEAKNEGCLILLLSSSALTISLVFIFVMYFNEYKLMEENPLEIYSVIAITFGNLVNFRFLHIIFDAPKKKIYTIISSIYSIFAMILVIMYFSLGNSREVLTVLSFVSILIQSFIFLIITIKGYTLMKRMKGQEKYSIQEVEKVKYLTLWAIFAIIASGFLGVSTIIPSINYGLTFGISWIFACLSGYSAYRTYVQNLKK